MIGQPDARRVALTFLMTIWLSVQSLMIGVSPTWGMVLPHDHVVLGAVSAAAWQRHLLEHQHRTQIISRWNCNLPHASGAGMVLASVPENAEVASVLSFLTADCHDGTLELNPLDRPSVSIGDSAFYALDISYRPLLPPPNL